MKPSLRVLVVVLALFCAVSAALFISGCGRATTKSREMWHGVGDMRSAESGPRPRGQWLGMSDISSLGPDATAGFPHANRTMGIALGPQGPDLGLDEGSLPALEEEIWVIARSDVEEPAARADDDTVGTGALMTRLPDDDKEVPLPLRHTDVKASIAGYIGSVEVTQQFHNPFDGKIEAVYVFPLPQNAAVHEFLMMIGERRIRGIIRERQEAERIYQEARSQGYVASLLTQERPNIFTQHVANIEPGKEIDVAITYINTLAYDDGWYEFVFPMVVGPRFNPPGTQDGVGAVGHGRRGASGQRTEVEYLKPGTRSGHDIALEVDLDAGVTVEEIACPSHAIVRDTGSPQRTLIRLSELDTIPNKDFVLRYRVAGDRLKAALLTHEDERGGFFTFMLYPPDDLSRLQRKPVEMVFVLDCSGSMRGQPIAQAKAAVQRALRKMDRDDTFQVIRFSNNASALGPAPLPATPENVRRALRYVDSLEGQGGTMMIEGIKAALDFPHDPRRLRIVAFLTDGFIGNEVEILGAVHQRLGATRIFSFGVGSSPNRFLLNRMAKIGRGAVAYVGLKDSAAAVMDAFFDRVSHPALTDLAVDWGGMQVDGVYPSALPDLFVGRAVVLTGRFSGQLPEEIRVEGKTGDGQRLLVHVPVSEGDARGRHPGLAFVWARKRIAEIADRATYEANPQLADEIRQVALEYGIMSAFTAFVAVDSTVQTAGAFGTTVHQPVPVPDGVRYETTVTE